MQAFLRFLAFLALVVALLHAVHVEVGSVVHPMNDEHLIAFVCLVTEKGYQIAELTSADKPEADFAIAEGDRAIKVYEYCNLHGLWVAEV